MPDAETHPAAQRGRVAPAYLEKSSVRLFSTPELVRGLNGGGLVYRFSGRDEDLRRAFRARMFVALKQVGLLPHSDWMPLTTEPFAAHTMVWTAGDDCAGDARLTKHVRASASISDPERAELVALLADF